MDHTPSDNDSSLLPAGSRRGRFALVDCNNFYASCERVFRPSLNGRPLIVLSSNDGCIIARSNEAKALGIAMGEPFFKYRRLVEQNDVTVFSSNFALYGDMSRRVMGVMCELVPDIEMYSIDEAFIDLSRCGLLDADPTSFARRLRERITRCTGIPVSIGLAPTKTLAKAANFLAKKSERAGGVLNLIDSPHIDSALERVPVRSVWGVGQKSAEWLIARGISTARQLRDINEETIERYRGVVGWRLVNELRGIACLSFHDCPPPPKGVISSRSFGQKTSSRDEVKGAIAGHIATAAEKIRSQRLAARWLSIFLLTRLAGSNPYKDGDHCAVRLPTASNNPAVLTHYALGCVDRVFKEGSEYKKAGVMLDNLVPDDQIQGSLFDDTPVTPPGRPAIIALDRINADMGQGTIRLAAQLSAGRLRARHDHTSPAYTTSWAELPVVHCR